MLQVAEGGRSIHCPGFTPKEIKHDMAETELTRQRARPSVWAVRLRRALDGAEPERGPDRSFAIPVQAAEQRFPV